MRILVVSDTHRDFDTLSRLVAAKKSEIDMLIHLGDGESDIDDLRAEYPLVPVSCVSGNCDIYSMAPGSTVVTAEDVRIFITHGHLFGVNYSLDSLITEAKHQNAQVALFGHTHRQLYRFERGVQVMNPGSLGSPRDQKRGFATIEIREGQAICDLQRFI